MHRPHLRRAPGNDLDARGRRAFRNERRPAAARAAQHDLGVEVQERLRLPDARTEHLVAYEPEAAGEAEDAAPMTQVEVIGEVREAVVRGSKAAEAVLRDPLDVFHPRRAAARHLLRAVDEHHVVRPGAAEVRSPGLRFLTPVSAVDDEPRTADGELVAKDVAVAIRRRGFPVEQEHVAGLAGEDVEADPAERPQLGGWAPPRQVHVHAAARLSEDEERPHAREVPGRGEVGLVQDNGRRGEELGRSRHAERRPVKERQLPVGMEDAREQIGHALDAFAGPHGEVVPARLKQGEELDVRREHVRMPRRGPVAVPPVLVNLLAELLPEDVGAHLEPAAGLHAVEEPPQHEERAAGIDQRDVGRMVPDDGGQGSGLCVEALDEHASGGEVGTELGREEHLRVDEVRDAERQRREPPYHA